MLGYGNGIFMPKVNVVDVGPECNFVVQIRRRFIFYDIVKEAARVEVSSLIHPEYFQFHVF